MPYPVVRKILRSGYIFLVSLFLLGSNTALAQKNSKPSSRIQIDKTRHDFGEVFAGEVLTCIFNVRNMGGGTLELSESGTASPPSSEKAPNKPKPSGMAAWRTRSSDYLKPRQVSYVVERRSIALAAPS
ncbi:MAG: hypothetical protein DMF61_06750 [Blastocatellia bacterium AA13]|nr:MAG: hypothetical protein DMF61_06750 [Blastocatellia bacterium AA13]